VAGRHNLCVVTRTFHLNVIPQWSIAHMRAHTLTLESLVTAMGTQSLKPSELMRANSSSKLHADITTP